MSDVIIVGNHRAVCAYHFACALTGLSVVEMLPDEVEEVREAEPIDFALQAKQLMGYGERCYDVPDYFNEPPPTVPRKLGKPTSAKGKGQYVARKILPCNRK